MSYEVRGDKDDPRNKLYNSAAWKRTRKAVLIRDGYTCVKCGKEANTVHHTLEVLTLIALGRDPLDPNECESLCAVCHGAEDGWRNGVRPIEKKKPNRFLQTVLNNKHAGHGGA